MRISSRPVELAEGAGGAFSGGLGHQRHGLRSSRQSSEAASASTRPRMVSGAGAAGTGGKRQADPAHVVAARRPERQQQRRALAVGLGDEDGFAALQGAVGIRVSAMAFGIAGGEPRIGGGSRPTRFRQIIRSWSSSAQNAGAAGLGAEVPEHLACCAPSRCAAPRAASAFPRRARPAGRSAMLAPSLMTTMRSADPDQFLEVGGDHARRRRPASRRRAAIGRSTGACRYRRPWSARPGSGPWGRAAASGR